MRPERGPITGPNDKRERREKGQEELCYEVREKLPVIDTWGESGRWLAALISCPQSVYGIEQIQHSRCAGDKRTASNGHRAGLEMVENKA